MDYSSAVARHFAAPKKARELPGGSAGLVAGEAEDRTLHVWVRFQLKIVDGVVAAAGFQAYGCPHTVAAASAVVSTESVTLVMVMLPSRDSIAASGPLPDILTCTSDS